MMSMTMSLSIYQRRETAAQIGTFIAGIIILIMTQAFSLHHDVLIKDESINLTIIEPDVAPEQIVQQVIQTPPPEKIEKVIEPPKEIVPVMAAPAPAIQEIVQPPKVEPPVQQTETAPVPKVEQQIQPKSNTDAEGLFAQDVRSKIERKKIYPDTARDLGMSGEVEVLYELDRSGNLIRAEISTSSGFKLLDQAALKAVKTASYKSFPSDAWLGVSSKVFRTKLVFSINS
jgi:protein TonB